MTIESETCTVSRPVLMNLIYAVVHTLASSEYVPLSDDEHYRGLVTSQVESILALADEAGVDLWAETTEPVGREMMPIATSSAKRITASAFRVLAPSQVARRCP